MTSQRLIPQTTLGLSGGGMLGFTHLGFLEGLMGMGIDPRQHFSCFQGSSVGAFFALILSVGVDLFLLRTILLQMDFKELVSQHFSLKSWAQSLFTSLLKTEDLQVMIEHVFVEVGLDPRMTLQQAFAVHKKPCWMTVANLSRLDYFTPCAETTEWVSHQTDPEMRCSEALALTMAYPALVPFNAFRGSVCTDGGMFCPLPVREGIDTPESLLLVQVLRPETYTVDKAPENFLDNLSLIYRCYGGFVFKLFAEKYNAQGFTILTLYTSGDMLDFSQNFRDRCEMMEDGRKMLWIYLLLGQLACQQAVRSGISATQQIDDAGKDDKADDPWDPVG
jgi:predicted acylesterase/phospholipase RssA